MVASHPRRIVIPSLDVSSSLEVLGLNPDQTMQVPQDPAKGGWFRHGAQPGERGPTVIAGHVTWNQDPVVFFDLARIDPGARVEVERADGRTIEYVVTRVQQIAKDEFPTQAVYGDTDSPELRLITCGGAYDDDRGRYLDNVIVYGEIAD